MRAADERCESEHAMSGGVSPRSGASRAYIYSVGRQSQLRPYLRRRLRHQPVDRALRGHVEQLLTLLLCERPRQRQRHIQPVDTLSFLAVVAVDGHLDVLDGNVLAVGVPERGHRLARTERTVVQLVRRRTQILSSI